MAESIRDSDRGTEGVRVSENGLMKRRTTELLAEHRESLRRIAYRMIGDKDLAEDVVQDVYVAVWESGLGYNGASSLKTFLYRVVINKCIDVKRRRSRFSRILEILSRERHGYPQDTYEVKDLARRILSSIGPEYRTPLILAEVDGMSYGEIAEMLHLTPGTVRSRIFRCREKLRKQLESMGYVR